MNVEIIAYTQINPDLNLDITTEELPGYTARMSYRSSGSHDANIKLNKALIKHGHHTPLEAVQYVILVENVSKILLGQITRHRIGIGFTAQSGRRVNLSDVDYYLPNVDYSEAHDHARQIMKDFYMYANRTYKRLLERGIKPQEARYVLPASRLTSFYMYVNARALRHFFELRLDKHAEGEINKLARIIFDKVYKLHPSLYEDLKYETSS